MKAIIVVILLMASQVLAEVKVPASCPPVIGHILVGPRGEIYFYSNEGHFVFNILSYQFEGLSPAEARRRTYFVNFNEDFRTVLYSAEDCAVQGELKVREIYPQERVR